MITWILFSFAFTVQTYHTATATPATVVASFRGTNAEKECKDIAAWLNTNASPKAGLTSCVASNTVTTK